LEKSGGNSLIGVRIAPSCWCQQLGPLNKKSWYS